MRSPFCALSPDKNPPLRCTRAPFQIVLGGWLALCPDATPVLHAVHVSEAEVQRALVAGGVLGPLEAWLADAAKGGKDALVVAEVRSCPASKTSIMLGLYSGFTCWAPWRRGSRMQQRAARTRWSWRTCAAFPLARHQTC